MDNDRDEIESQLVQAKKHYRNLVRMQEELEQETNECVDHFISCHIHYILLENNNISLEVTKSIIDRHFPHRFWMGEEPELAGNWIGTHKFNFGDLVFDKKFCQKGIIVKEKKTFVTVWYYEINFHDCNTKNRHKEDKNLTILKRCDLD